MKLKIIILFSCFTLNCCLSSSGSNVAQLLSKGWQQLIVDDDSSAMLSFGEAYELAFLSNDISGMANSLLYMGFCSYGSSYSQGLQYAMKSMDLFRKIEKLDHQAGVEGRSRCLQLISTIQSRQGKFKEAIRLSHESLEGLSQKPDSFGTRGLSFSSLGKAHEQLGNSDSVTFYFTKALNEQLNFGLMAYVPGAYLDLAAIERERKNFNLSKTYLDRALAIGDSMKNRQAIVLALIGLSDWHMETSGNTAIAGEFLFKATAEAGKLADKMFLKKVLTHISLWYQQQQNFKEAFFVEQKIVDLTDQLAAREKDAVVKQLEVQFGVAQKERLLAIAQKENQVSKLTNVLLYGALAILLLVGITTTMILKRINRRDKLLLKAREELLVVKEEQKVLREKQLQNELEFKEGQMSALALQMMQKNELLTELRSKLESFPANEQLQEFNQLITKSSGQDAEWDDFNTCFESVNKNFYSKIKSLYPDISPNDLRLCALIKLNLSIKEMAGILNISPDSVKTARYRLRKKLQLNTEDNLSEFILSI